MTTEPAPAPKTATEARTALDAKMADKEWGGRYLEGGAAERREFVELTTLIAGGGEDTVKAAIAGDLPAIPSADQRLMADTASWLADHGFPPKAVFETLTEKEPTAEDIARARTWKAQAMRSPEFVKRYLSGEPDAAREMLAADVVLTVGSSAKAVREAQAAAK